MNGSVIFVRDALDLKLSRDAREVVEPISIREWLDREGIEEFDWPTLCLHNGESKGRSKWPETVINHGDVVHFVSLPAGGGGGGKNPLATILSLALVLTGFGAAAGIGIFAGMSAWASFGTFVALGAAGYAVNALFPPSGPKSPKSPSPTYSLRAEGNRARINETIPVAYGRIRVKPDYVEQPWAEFHGQDAIPDKGESSPSKQIGTQYLYQAFALTRGRANVVSVYVGQTDVRGFEEIQWAVYQPGETITLIPDRVATSEFVGGQELKGPNHNSFLPATPGDAPTGQQIRPYQAGTGVSGGSDSRDFYYTADSGVQSTPHTVNSVSVTVGTLVDNDLDFLSDADLIAADLIGKQIYIGGAQGSSVDYADTDEENWQDPATAIQSYKLVNPRRLRTIVDVAQHTLYVRPAWDATYGPHQSGQRNYHIRDDFTGPFFVNDAETLVDRIGIDLAGPPLIQTNAAGEKMKLSVGCRFEIRRVNDSDAAVAGADGEWQPLGVEYTQTVSQYVDLGIAVYESDIIGTIYYSDFAGVHLVRGAGAFPGRRATFAIAGSGGGIQQIGLSQVWKVDDLGLPSGRYQIRGRRTSKQKQESSYSHNIYWAGLKGFIVTESRTYPEVAVLAVKSKATGDLQALTNREIFALIEREIPVYGDGHSGTALGSNPIAINSGSNIATVHATAHGLVPTQPFILTGVTSNPGGIANIWWLVTDLEVLDVPDVDHFRFVVAQTADENTTGDGGSGVELNSDADWYGPTYTSNPAWVLADACRDADYGLGIPDADIDIASIRSFAKTWDSRGTDEDGNPLKDEFNGTFDSANSALDALNSIARVGRARVIQPGGIITPVRDEPRVIRSAFFSERNIVRDSFGISYQFPREDSPDCVQVEYFDKDVWKPKLVPYTSELTGSRPQIIKLFGITNRQQGFREAMYEQAQLRYRRRAIRLATDYEGHIPTIFDKVSVTHSMPGWGQSGDLTGYNAGTFRVTCTEAPTFDTVGGELVENWNFENNVDGWEAGGSNVTVTRSNVDASVGDYCARAIKASGGSNVLQITNATYITDLTNGTHYILTADVKAGSVGAEGKVAFLVLRLTGGAQGTVDRVSSSVTLSTSWQTLTLSTTIDQPDRDLATIQVGIRGTGGSGNAAANDVLLVDNVHAAKSGASITHYIAFQLDNGSLDGPHVATAVGGQPNQVQLAGALAFTPNTDGIGRERTKYKFGRSDTWHRDCIVTAIVPRGDGRVELELVNEDDRVHEADGVTYVPPTDEERLNRIPEAPVITWVIAAIFGPLSDRKLRVLWSAAKGAKGYLVEQSDAGSGDRRVGIEIGYVVGGPFTAGETIKAFDATPTLFATGDGVGNEVGQARVNITFSLHGLTTGDYVFLAGLPGIDNIPADEVNGAHQIVVDDPSNFHYSVSTTSTAGFGLAKLKTAYETWSFRVGTGATGTTKTATANGSRVLDYDYVSGDEINTNEIVAGLTSQAFFFASGDSEPNTSWTRVGLGLTVSPHIEGDVVLTSGYPVVESISVRVRAVGSLLGPWKYATAVAVTEDQLTTQLVVGIDGSVTPPTDGLGIALQKSGWVVADGSVVLTGTIVTLGAHHRVKGIEIEVVTAFNGVPNLLTLTVGTETDDDAYMTVDFWTPPNTLDVVGLHSLSLFSVEGGQSGVGVALGKYSSDPQTIVWTLTAASTVASVGKAVVTAIHEYVTPDPTL